MASNALKLIMEAAAHRNDAEARAQAEKQQKLEAEHRSIMATLQPLVDIADEAAKEYPDRISVSVHHSNVYITLHSTKDPRYVYYGETRKEVSIRMQTDTTHKGLFIEAMPKGQSSFYSIDGGRMMDLSRATAILIDLLAHAVR